MIGAAWTLAGLVLAAQAWLSYALRGDPILWTRALAVWLSWAWIWALLTPLVLYVANRYPLVHPAGLARVSLHLAAGAALTCLQLAAFAACAPWVGAVSTQDTWHATFLRLLGTTFLLNLPVYAVMIGIAHVVRLSRAARERERRALQLEAQLADARLLTLRAQLRPHFLFNALNTVAVLMREDVDQAERVLGRISDLLRASLDGDDAHEIALGDEIALLETYLAIERARYEDRLSYRIDVAPDLRRMAIPRMILQPLVENAVEHGIAPRRAPGCITVRAVRDGAMLDLRITDDGVGLSADHEPGIGLSNTRSRLCLLYGSQQQFAVTPAEGGGVTVNIRIPLRALAAA